MIIRNIRRFEDFSVIGQLLLWNRIVLAPDNGALEVDLAQSQVLVILRSIGGYTLFTARWSERAGVCARGLRHAP